MQTFEISDAPADCKCDFTQGMNVTRLPPVAPEYEYRI